MGEKGIQDNNMIKRKRLDARAFRKLYIAQAKKHKSGGIRETAPDRSDRVLYDSSDNPEDSSLRLRESKSEAHLLHSKQLRTDSEVKLQPSNGDVKLQPSNGDADEQYGSNAQGCEQASSSTDVNLHAITPGIMIAGENLRAGGFNSVQHERVLSEVVSGSDGMHKDVIEAESNCRVHGSEELSDSKRRCPSFSEFWVPVGFSHLQLEKYCEILIENSFLLCSTSKRGVLDALHDVLTTIRMCCDHPYLVDKSFENFVNGGHQTDDDYLRTGIKASGKLLLLEKMLQDAREKQLRVLIVFQSKHSNSQLHLRHILDDFIQRRFGAESYVHIYQEFDQTKRQAALDLFNSKESGKFVILIEKSSCQSSVKLSSIDFAILFNSDWNPMNDLRSLQKMSIQSKFEHLKVFRLYLSHSVEEKVLVLAKGGTVLDSTIHHFSHNICHMLLLWGAPYLFERLDDFHSCCSSISDSHSLSEHDILLDVFHDLSELLSSQEGHINCSSLISKVLDSVEGYSVNASLYGEKDSSTIDGDLPLYAIWVSLLDGKKPRWKLLPESSHRMRRKVDSLAHNSDCGTKNHLTNHQYLHCSSEASDRKPRLGKSPSLVSAQITSMVAAGNPDSSDNIVQSSPCWTHLSISNVEEICNRRMHKLLIKQTHELNAFSRIKGEKMAELEQEHQLEQDQICQGYQESAVKQAELKKMDNIFKEKVKEHDHLMDIKWKELQDLHWASRKKEKQLEDRSINFLMKNSKEQIAELELEIHDLLNNSVHPPSNALLLSESQHVKGTENGMIDVSSQNGDSGLPSDHLLTKTQILSVESDDEDDAASMLRVAVVNIVECDDPIFVPENGASYSAASRCEEQSQDLPHASNREIEGDGSTNMDSSVETLRGVIGDHPVGLMSRCLESDGENDVMVIASGEHGTRTEPFNYASDVGTSKENQLLSGQKDMESSPNLPITELQNGDCNLERSAGSSCREIRSSSPGVGINFTKAGHQSVDNLLGLPSPRLATSSCALEKTQACSTSGISLPLEKGVTATDKAQRHSDLGHHSNILPTGSVNRLMESGGENNLERNMATSSNLPNKEVQNVDHNEEPRAAESNRETEGRDATNLNTTYPQLNVENVTVLPSSTLASGSCGVVQPITCTISGNSSPLDLPLSANLACNQITQTTAALAVTNCQSPGMPLFCLLNQSSEHLVNLGSCNLPMVQTAATMSPPLQSVLGQDQPHVFSGTTVLRPANNYVHDNSSLMPNIPPSSGSDPLLNELVRIQKEHEEAIKIHENKMKNYRSDCEKDIEVIRKKYDLLLREAENEFLKKKQDFESHIGKVYASKLLADTLRYHFQRQAPSQEALLSGVLQLSIPQHHTSERTILPSSDILPQVQVVHQLSDLISVDPAQPQISSVTNGTRYLLGGYQTRARAPLICSSRPTSSLPMRCIPTPSYGVQNQQILAPLQPRGSLPGMHQHGHALGHRVHLDDSQENPVFFL